jgi:predicted DNA-binding protein (UPF0251 family)
MPRPKKKRHIVCDPDICYFKPRGVPLRELEEVGLTVDEYEAIRLADLFGLSHEEAGKRMGVSRATFGRIIQNARRVVADALVNGMAIRIEGGAYMAANREAASFMCGECGKVWKELPDTGPALRCPRCSHDTVRQLLEP